MATKSKVKKGGKKKTTKKKPKGKKGKSRAGLTRGIGILSTINVPQALRQAFRAGLGDPSVFLDVVQARSYRREKLKEAFDQFNADSRIGMIITVGGLIAYRAAEVLARKPFICLVGLEPATPGANCYGGVSLQSFAANPDRIRHLGTKGFAPNQIGLLQNPNSAMAAEEAEAWGGARPITKGGVDGTGGNDPSVFPQNFAAMPAAITAVVVSADPFFQESKNELVAAADGSGKYICYPVQDYGGATPPPTHLKATLFGPALKDPFALLGERAAKVLNTGAKLIPLFAAATNIVVDL